MRVLVTGAGGFVGRHLCRELSRAHHDVLAYDITFPSLPAGSPGHYIGDLLDAEGLNTLVGTLQPEACIHLGGMAFAPAGHDHAPRMFSVNVIGTLNLLEAFRKKCPAARILVASTAHVYGDGSGPRPVMESDPLRPVSMYAISKAAADQATLACARQHGMHCMTARPNNHIGPGQSPSFVIASFAQQLKNMAAGSAPEIHTGNLESIRDFTDVRDVVVAYRLLIEKGRTGHAYNISSQKLLTIQSVFNELCTLAGVSPRVIIDKDRFRPTDASPLLDISRIQADTGWAPQLPLSRTLTDILAGF